MNEFKLSNRSLSRLEGVHPDLVRVVKTAINLTEVDFGVTEGIRSIERQKELLAQGKSTTMNSRHLTGHAVDLVAYRGSDVTWDWAGFATINLAMQEASKLQEVPIIWGGSWKTFKDGCHWELDRKYYP